MVPFSLLPCTKSVHQFLCSYSNLVNLNSCFSSNIRCEFYCPSFSCAQYKKTKTLEVPSATHVSGIPLNIFITTCITKNFTFVLCTDWNRLRVDDMLRVAVTFFSSLQSIQNGPVADQASYPVAARISSQRLKLPMCKGCSHLQIVPRLRMRGTTPPLTHIT